MNYKSEWSINFDLIETADRSDALQLHVRPDRRSGVAADQHVWPDDLVDPGPDVPSGSRRPSARDHCQAETGSGLILQLQKV